MTIAAAIREQVRQRANFACEFCGVTEIDTAGHLTIDHYCPQSKSGDDSLNNLLYLCNLCNQYKAVTGRKIQVSLLSGTHAKNRPTSISWNLRTELSIR